MTRRGIQLLISLIIVSTFSPRKCPTYESEDFKEKIRDEEYKKLNGLPEKHRSVRPFSANVEGSVRR